jgi:hypothetical protein
MNSQCFISHYCLKLLPYLEDFCYDSLSYIILGLCGG